MASSFVQLTREIEALKKKAELARKQEAGALIAVIKTGIATYGLTAQDLGLTVGGDAKRGPAKKSKSVKPAADKPAQPVASTLKYQDQAGNSWSGRGPKPGWVKAALAAGLDITDLLSGAPAKPAAAPKAPARKATKPAGGKAKAPSAKKSKASAKPAKPAEEAASPAAAKPASTLKYKDDAGNGWSGRGPKPAWLRDALAAGKTLEDMLA
jgi:DNA-binding protein H-NS